MTLAIRQLLLIFCIALLPHGVFAQTADTTFYRDGRIQKITVKKGGDSTETRYFASGMKAGITRYRNGKLHGKQISRNQSGEKAFERHYYQGHSRGKWTDWYPSGQLQKKQAYKLKVTDGDTISVLHGKHEEYYNTGQLRVTRHYKMGLPHRKEKYYSPNGELARKTRYKIQKDSVRISVKHGTEKVYYPSGNIVERTKYRNGEKHGEYREWQEDGTLKRLVTYREDRVNGLVKTWNLNGILFSEAHQYSYKSEDGYYRTRYDGRYRQYYDNGRPNVEGQYEDFVKSGEWRYYCNEEDRLYKIEHYRNDQLSGPYTTWNCKTGNLQEEKYYRLITVDGEEKSVLHGDFTTYHQEDGTQREAGSYKDGENHGTRISYYVSGAPNMVIDYNEGLLSGRYIIYNEDSTIQKLGNYTIITKNDKKTSVEHGRQATWFADGKLASEKFMEKGKQMGLERTFYEHGEMKAYRIPLVNTDKVPYAAQFQFYPDGSLRDVSFHRFHFPGYHFYPNGTLKHIEEPWGQSKSLKLTWLVNGTLVGNMRRKDHTNQFNEYSSTAEANHYRDFFLPVKETGFRPMDSNFTGKWQFPPTAKAPLIEANLRDGKLTGKFVVRQYRGDTLAWFTMKDGRPHGRFIVYSGDMLPLETGEVKNGIATGTWTGYHKNGEMSRESVSNDSGEVLIKREGYENGHLSIYQDFRTGEVIQYFEDGKVRSRRDPIPDSTGFSITEYHANGQVRTEYGVSDIKNFPKQGAYTTYHKDGTVDYQVYYLDNNRVGKFTQNYPNGQLKTTGQYEDNKAEGEWRNYNQDGSLKTIVTYKEGVVVSTEEPGECDCPPAEQESINYAQRLLHWASYDDVKNWSFPFHAPLDTFYERLFVRRHYGDSPSWGFRLMAFQDVYMLLPDAGGIKLLFNPCEARSQHSFFDVSARINPENREATRITLKSNHSAVEFDSRWLTVWNLEEYRPVMSGNKPLGTRLTFEVSEFEYSQSGIKAEGAQNFCFPYSRIANTNLFMDFDYAKLLLNAMEDEMQLYMWDTFMTIEKAREELYHDYLQIGREFTGLIIPQASMHFLHLDGSDTLKISAKGNLLLLNNTFMQGMLRIPVKSNKGGTVSVSTDKQTIQLEVNYLLKQLERNKLNILNWWLKEDELLVYFKLSNAL